MEMTKEQASAAIAEKIAAAEVLLHEATVISDKYKVIFSFSVSYGMGGDYVPVNISEDDWYGSSRGWISSSNSC